MAWLNIVAVLFLPKPALKIVKDNEMQKKARKGPVFDPGKAGIEGADCWEKEYS